MWPPVCLPFLILLCRGFPRAPRTHRTSLITAALAAQAMSAYQWQNMSTSGLTREEIATLLHIFSHDTAPKHADAFATILLNKYHALGRGSDATKAAPKPKPRGAPPPMKRLSGIGSGGSVAEVRALQPYQPRHTSV